MRIHEVQIHSYWNTGKIGTGFQSYLDVKEDIEKCNDLTQEEYDEEMERLIKCRKDSWVRSGQSLKECRL